MDNYNELQNMIADILIDYTNKLDSLLEYYDASNNALKNKIEEHRKKFKVAYIIKDLFNSIFESPNKDFDVNKINEEVLIGKKKVKDIFQEISYDKESGKISFSIHSKIADKKMYDPNNARKDESALVAMIETLNASILSSMIIIFEQFLSSIYFLLIKYSPEKYFENKTTQITELLKYQDVNDFISDKIDSFVENEMYDSLNVLNKIINKENINPLNNEVFNQFIEIYYRRNMWVHNDGYANEKYINNVSRTKVKNDVFLGCDDNYFYQSIISIQKTMFELSFYIISKYKINDQLYDKISLYYFDKLQNDEYELSKFFNSVFYKCKKFDFLQKTIGFVNYLISLKGLGDSEVFEKEIAAFDVSAMEIKFVIAKHILLNEYSIASELIEQEYDSKETPIEVKEWPLYKDFRKTNFYNELVERHKTDFEFVEYTE